MAEETEEKAEVSTGGDDITDEVSDIPFLHVDASKIKIKGEKTETTTVVEDDDEDPLKGLNKGKEGQDIDKEEEKSEEKEEKKEEKEEEKTETEEKEEKEEPGDDEKVTYSQEEFQESVNGMISKIGGDSVKSLADIPKLVREIAELRAEAAKPKEPVFKSEKAKLIFDLANKVAGLELETAGQLVHVLRLGDVTKLGEKEKQFEAYHLSRPDLTRERAQALFEQKYSERFSDLENNIVQQDEHALATREAEKKIAEIHESFKSAKGEDASAPVVDQAKLEAIHRDIDETFKSFDGLTVPFGDKPEEALNLPLDKEEVSVFNEYLKNPSKMIEDIIEACHDEHGNFNKEMYLAEMYCRFKPHEFAEEAHKLGRTLGQIAKIKDVKQADKKVENKAPKERKKTFEDAMLSAVETGK